MRMGLDLGMTKRLTPERLPPTKKPVDGDDRDDNGINYAHIIHVYSSQSVSQ